MNKAEMVELYQKVLAGEKISANDDNIQKGLKLAGLVSEKVVNGKRYLQCRNQIFAKNFNETWIRQQLADNLIFEVHNRWYEANSRGEAGEEFLLKGQLLEE